MNGGSLFLHSLLLARPLGYLVVFFGMMIEGDAMLFTAAFLTHQRYFDLGDMAAVVFSGVLLGDLAWYRLGSSLPRIGFISRWLERLVAPFDAHLRERTFRTLFVSKFAYGLHHPILMRAGMLGVKPRAFVASDLAATILWIFIVGGLGYFSSFSFVRLRHSLRSVELALVAGLALFILFWHFVSLRTRRRL